MTMTPDFGTGSTTPPPIKKKGVIKIFGDRGDQKIAWDADDEKDVIKARTRFGELLRGVGGGQRHKAFLMDDSGKKGKEITEFDPSAGAILMVPQMVGG